MSEQEIPRTVEEVKRQVLTDAYNVLTDNPAPEQIDETLAAVHEAGRQAARMPSVEQVAEVIRAHNGADGARWRCRCGWSAYDHPSDLAGHQAERVVALWGAP